jgi:hypothetical protein
MERNKEKERANIYHHPNKSKMDMVKEREELIERFSNYKPSTIQDVRNKKVERDTRFR